MNIIFKAKMIEVGMYKDGRDKQETTYSSG